MARIYYCEDNLCSTKGIADPSVVFFDIKSGTPPMVIRLLR